jgi:non-canonical purine NTP pyrophosphatase (RdgB/HAM1 family)
MRGLLEKLQGVTNRGLVYYATMVYFEPHYFATRREKTPRVLTGKTCAGTLAQTFTGTLVGQAATQPRGKAGFGYDPIMIPSGEERTLAEMSEAEKNRLSHRQVALRKFASWYRRQAKLSL